MGLKMSGCQAGSRSRSWKINNGKQVHVCLSCRHSCILHAPVHRWLLWRNFFSLSLVGSVGRRFWRTPPRILGRLQLDEEITANALSMHEDHCGCVTACLHILSPRPASTKGKPGGFCRKYLICVYSITLQLSNITMNNQLMSCPE